MSSKSDTKEIQPASNLQRILWTCVFAVAVRYYLMTSKYQTLIANHVEVSTPLNSWKRISEGLHLMSRKISPYDGDLLHETPMALLSYKILLNVFQNKVHLMMLTFDILTGILLYGVCKKYVSDISKEEDEQKKTFAKDTGDALLKLQDIANAPFFVLLAYLFNPFSLLSCVGHSTTVFHSFYLSGVLFSLVYGLPMVCGVFLAVCSSMSLYVAILIIPVSIYFTNVYKSVYKATLCVISFLISSLVIMLICSRNGQDFSYIRNVYGCILTVPDLQPNIGLFWYFFTEMFDHFRELFIYAFQINASVLYLIPLSVKFRKEPFLLTVALIFIITIFKSYPSVGEVGFTLSLLPSFVHLFSYTQQIFLVGVILIISSSLAPVLWYLWIYCNSANANFYFGVTLAFAIAQIFLLTDLLFAQVKRGFILKHGNDRKIDGEEAILCLE